MSTPRAVARTISRFPPDRPLAGAGLAVGRGMLGAYQEEFWAAPSALSQPAARAQNASKVFLDVPRRVGDTAGCAARRGGRDRLRAPLLRPASVFI